MDKSAIIEEDLNYIHSCVDMKKFEGKTLMISGATGLIGKTIINSLISWNKKSSRSIKIVAVVRNEKKAKMLFGEKDYLTYVVGDITNVEFPDIDVDYIIHAASNTDSFSFGNHPINIINTAYKGTENLLKFSADKKIKRFVYLSSMEVYGTPENDLKIYENSPSNLQTSNVRSCYPESKRMCESLCVAYEKEFGIPFQVLRLTQTFGPGVEKNDNRVFAQFANSIIENKDIVLKTEGKTKRCYLYTADAVTAIFISRLCEQKNQFFNVANESSYCSIREMADMVVEKISGNRIKVVIDIDNDNKSCYAPTLCMNLCCDKINEIGWKANYSLIDSYKRMIDCMSE